MGTNDWQQPILRDDSQGSVELTPAVIERRVVPHSDMVHRVEMLAAADTVKAGQVITKDDLASVRVSADVSGLIPVTNIDQVVGRTARVEISKGQLVDTSQIATENLPGSDQQVVGVSLEAGRFPASGLTAGDVVDIVDVTSQKVTVSNAQVLDAAPTSENNSNSGKGWGSGAIVSVLVKGNDATKVASASAAGNIALVVTSVGQPIGDH